MAYTARFACVSFAARFACVSLLSHHAYKTIKMWDKNEQIESLRSFCEFGRNILCYLHSNHLSLCCLVLYLQLQSEHCSNCRGGKRSSTVGW